MSFIIHFVSFDNKTDLYKNQCRNAMLLNNYCIADSAKVEFLCLNTKVLLNKRFTDLQHSDIQRYIQAIFYSQTENIFINLFYSKKIQKAPACIQYLDFNTVSFIYFSVKTVFNFIKIYWKWNEIKAYIYNYGPTCIKRSHLGQRKKWPYKTGDLLKEVQFIWNFLRQDKKKWPLNTGDCMCRFDCT
jgi:hypothetical protein